MRVVVVGAGAWGLPAAAELAERGHRVDLVDRFGPANEYSSSPGPTRIWRLSHPDPVRVRLALRCVEAMERLGSRHGSEVFLRRGLLWRDDETVDAVVDSLGSAGASCERVAAQDVGRFLPGLRPDGRDAVWQRDAGPVLAAVSMAAQQRRFDRAGGDLHVGLQVREVHTGPGGARVVCDGGRVLDADVVVLAAGPGAGDLLAGLGLDLRLTPRLEQVAHIAHLDGTALSDGLPCWFDGPQGDRPAMYAMATPGVGYKIGVDRALRDWSLDDLDRTPDQDLLDMVQRRAAADLHGFEPRPFDAQVCCWTESPDNRFIIDSVADGIVVACGDAGEGFKFSALMGEVLADLAEGRTPDADVASFGLARFADGVPDEPHVLGR